MVPSLTKEYLSGGIFGSALLVSGVYSPSVIISQMELTSFHMVKCMLPASAVSALVIYVADRTRHAPLNVRIPKVLGLFPFDGNIIGGSLVGIGMALAGACPGTVLVQLGLGISTGLVAAIGAVVGALAYATAQPYIESKAKQLHGNKEGGISAESPCLTVDTTLGLSKKAVLFAWEVMCIALLFVLQYTDGSSREPRQSGLVHPIVGGLLIGAAQAIVVGLNRHAVGISTAYADIARWMQITRGPDMPRNIATPAVAFAFGVHSISVLYAFADPESVVLAAGGLATIKPINAFLGGVAMIFGARLAGGCTSGHGISGLATFSWASFVTVAAMFGAGILARLSVA